jgi:uncharacterized peroxidase-related enzyme
VLADYETAPISPKLVAILAYLEKLTLTPDAIGPDDVVPLRAAGLSDEAIADAVHVCAMFNIYDRLADALAWEVPASPEFWPKQSRYLLKSGYEGGRRPKSSD